MTKTILQRPSPFWAPLIALTVALAGVACGGDTGRSRTRFDLSVRGDPGATFTTSAGYDVTLTAARISVAKVEFFDGEPLFSEKGVLDLIVGTAHAHPGHYQEGEALGDVLTPAVVDLLSDAPPTLEGNGVTGAYRSARVDIAPGSEGEASVVIAGTARRDGVDHPFAGELRLDESVAGVAVGHRVDGARGRFAMRVHLPTWLDRAEFDEVGPSGALEPNTQPHTAWLRGVRNTSAYRFDFDEGGD